MTKPKKQSLTVQVVALLTLLVQAWAINAQSQDKAKQSFQQQRQAQVELNIIADYREFIFDVFDRCECGGE